MAAHPDDETVGAGGFLPRFSEVLFIHVTDGAPRDMRDALHHGFQTVQEYAEARRREFFEALSGSEVQAAETTQLGYADQEASLNLAFLAGDLARILAESRVDLVLVHPYEGGHPDHDAAAFATGMACQMLPSDRRPEIVEFTSYHNHGGQCETGVFLPNGEAHEIHIRLDEEDGRRKKRMLACFRTQQETLRLFHTDEERFRRAPDYDFSKPPHEGRLLYEQFPWGMTGERWRALAVAAQKELGTC